MTQKGGSSLVWGDFPLLRSLHKEGGSSDLTQREAEVLKLVVEGKSNRQIARTLGLSEKTVTNYLTHIFNKTSCENRAAATAFAIRHGLA